MPALKAVFFDLDGTLLDTAPDFEAVLNRLRREMDLAPLPMDAVRQSVSHGARALINLGFDAEEGSEDFENLRQQLLGYYTEQDHVLTQPFPGITALLEELDRHKLNWGIATNKPAEFTLAALERLRLQPNPVAVICPDHVQDRKPHPESLHLACEQAQCQPEEAIYIGDHLRDIQCGINAGMKTIAVNYGYLAPGDDTNTWEATHTVNQASELWPVIRRYL